MSRSKDSEYNTRERAVQANRFFGSTCKKYGGTLRIMKTRRCVACVTHHRLKYSDTTPDNDLTEKRRSLEDRAERKKEDDWFD